MSCAATHILLNASNPWTAKVFKADMYTDYDYTDFEKAVFSGLYDKVDRKTRSLI